MKHNYILKNSDKNTSAAQYYISVRWIIQDLEYVILFIALFSLLAGPMISIVNPEMASTPRFYD
jgi:hypothetical protein